MSIGAEAGNPAGGALRRVPVVPIILAMPSQRWLRIIPVALIMYTIAYIDRANLSMAFPFMKDELGMDPLLKGYAAGIFFFGYISLQIPGGFLAQRWSAKWFISILLVFWGLCATAGGLVQNSTQFLAVRFLLGVAESGVFPATLVLLANWFPRAERARANAFWSLCQPLALVLAGPLSGFIIDLWNARPEPGMSGWRVMLIAEGALPFIWLLVWIIFIEDKPRQARWISAEELEHLETTLAREAADTEPSAKAPFLKVLFQPQVLVMTGLYFLHNCGAYGCLFFLPEFLKEKLPESLRGQEGSQGAIIGILFAIPYVVTGIVMVLNARHSDRTGERRGHVALVEGLSGVFLFASALTAAHSFWLSFVFLCFATQGPFAALGPFWALASETLPKRVVGTAMGLVNALGNVGGFVGPLVVGYLNKRYESFLPGFTLLSLGLVAVAGMAFLLKKSPAPAAPETSPAKADR